MICVMLTGDVRVVAEPSGLSDSDEDSLLAVNASRTAFVVWSTHTWFVYSLGGLLLSTAQLTSVDADILTIDVYDDDDDNHGHRLCVVWKTEDEGVAVADSHTLRLMQASHRHYLYLQSSVIALSRHRQLVYMMIMMMMMMVVVVVVVVVAHLETTAGIHDDDDGDGGGGGDDVDGGGGGDSLRDDSWYTRVMRTTTSSATRAVTTWLEVGDDVKVGR